MKSQERISSIVAGAKHDEACRRIVQRLAEMDPQSGRSCQFCGAVFMDPHIFDCVWFLARQLAEQTE